MMPASTDICKPYLSSKKNKMKKWGKELYIMTLSRYPPNVKIK
jgi:hypothetical protein